MQPSKRPQYPVAKFVTSAVKLEQCPQDDVPEIALAGRSNAGKSSFLNSFSKSGPIAKVSQVPGKTRLLNFYDVAGKYRFVDMPGYGYASRSGGEVREWQGIVEDFLSLREQVAGVILFIDSRREWQEEESQLIEFLDSLGIETVVALTKCDKMSRSSYLQAKTKFENLTHLKVFPISSEKKFGIVELEDYIFRRWVQKKE